MIKELKKNIKFAWKYAKDQKFKIIGLGICTFLHIIISVVAPLVSAQVIVKLLILLEECLIICVVIFHKLLIVKRLLDYS